MYVIRKVRICTSALCAYVYTYIMGACVLVYVRIISTHTFSNYCLVIMFCLSIKVKVQHGLSLHQALKKPMNTRNLSTKSCLVYITHKNNKKHFIDWATDTALLGGQEVGLVNYLSNNYPF